MPHDSDHTIIRYRIVSLFPSWYCTSSCAHCFIPPELRRRDDYQVALLRKVVNTTPDWIKVFAISGGEPCGNVPRLLSLLRTIHRTGRVSTMVTNGLWAEDRSLVRNFLPLAYGLGLRGLSISYDAYHNPVISFEALFYVMEYAQKIGMAINIRGVGKESLRSIRKKMMTRLRIEQENVLLSLDLENTGNASTLKEDRVRSVVKRSCPWALNPVVLPNGEVRACDTPWWNHVDNNVICRGSINNRRLDDILIESSNDFLLVALIVIGPEGLSTILGIDHHKHKSRCQLCSFLLNNKDNVIALRGAIENSRKMKKELFGRYLLLEQNIRPTFLSQIGV